MARCLISNSHFLGQLIERAALATIDPDDRIEIRLVVARALARLGADEALDPDLMIRLAGEVDEVSDAERRYRYIDSLAIAIPETQPTRETRPWSRTSYRSITYISSARFHEPLRSYVPTSLGNFRQEA